MTQNLSALIATRGNQLLGVTPNVQSSKPYVEFVIVTQGGVAERVQVDALPLMELMTVLQRFYQAVNVQQAEFKSQVGTDQESG